jgi:hypothetical protein
MHRRALLGGVLAAALTYAGPVASVMAAEGTLVVDRSGGGDSRTINDALAAARAGAAGIAALGGRPAIRANVLRDNVAAIL